MADRRPIGAIDGPVSPDHWKRAVYKRAPKNFHVKPLRPEKHGSNYHYGFRIFPIKDDDATSIDRRTISSSGSVVTSSEYEIWRKWEDCLFFQYSLEMEYSRVAREKRNRLAAGKGIKKNGVYVHSDQAASWESLPFGPDPDAIARDIHEYVPKLSKKATLFRASQETIQQRYDELLAMMGALLSGELPTLIKEIKATNTFTDFFGLWRRDIDLSRKAASLKKPAADQPRQSFSSSIRSAFPASPSSLSVNFLPSPNKGKAPERAASFSTFAHSDSSSDDFVDAPRPSRMMNRGQGIPSARSRASSTESHSSGSLPSTPVMSSPLSSRQPLMAPQDVPLRFGHNPLGGERHPYSLQSLPEDRELISSPNSSQDEVSPRKRSGSIASLGNRNAKIYVPSSMESQKPPSVVQRRSLSRYSKASFQSWHSAADLRATAYLDELDVDYCLPSPAPMPTKGHSRISVSTLASVVTNSSVDAVMPRGDRSLANYVRPDSLLEEPEYELWSENEYDAHGDLLDAYFSDMAMQPPSPQDCPETPLTCHFSDRQFSMYSDRRASLSSQSTSSTGNPGVLSIKAMHEDDIVMLRLPSYISFDNLRRKIYDKFSQVEKPTISESFAIALLEQPPPSVDTVQSRSGRVRAQSFSTIGSSSSVPPKGGALRFISSQEKWDNVVATHQGKIVLRIIGSRE